MQLAVRYRFSTPLVGTSVDPTGHCPCSFQEVLGVLQCHVLAMFLKNIDIDVFDDVLQNAKHRANDASSDANRPPQPVDASVDPRGHCPFSNVHALSRKQWT